MPKSTVGATNLIKTQPSNKFIGVENNTDGVIIKGFVSVQMPDRDEDLVEPCAFDIPSYMAQPAVLVNHSLWTDRNGNKKGVGQPLSLHEVKLKNAEEDDNFIVWDVEAKKEVDTFPKSRNPNLKAGMRGLYGFFKITDPDVVDLIHKGELSAFSWRGKALPQYKYNEKEGKTFKSYSYIDMWEVSLVTAPNNVGGSFIVGKDAIHSIWYEKSKYTKQQAEHELQLQRFTDLTVVEDDENIYAYASNRQENENDLMVMKMTDGVTMLIGKPLEVGITGVSQVQLSKFQSAVDKTLEESIMADEKKTPEVVVVPATPVIEKTVETLSVPEVPTTPIAAVVEPDALVVKAVDATVAKLMPLIEGITSSVQALAQTVEGLVTKMATPVEPAKPPEPTNDDKLVEMQKTIQGLASSFQNVQKGLSGIVPAKPPRTETATEPQKKSDNPNSVFNGFFGIGARA